MMLDESKNLVGKTIKKIELSPDRREIKLSLSNGKSATGICEGDCCSDTWIEDLLDEEAAIDSPITDTGDIDLPEHLRGKTKTDNFEDSMQYYGYYIETAKGRFMIAYRNSSNGYYGGNLYWTGDL